MSVGWVLSFSDIGCTNRVKGSDRTWSSIATFGDDIKNRQRGEKYSNTILERLLNRQFAKVWVQVKVCWSIKGIKQL